VELAQREKAGKLLGDIAPDLAGLEIMLEKERIYPLYVREVKTPAAHILKENMLSLGGEAVTARGVLNHALEVSDVLLLGTEKQYKALAPKLARQPWGLKSLGQNILDLLARVINPKRLVWTWPGKELVIGEKVLVMGILNITPDSFSDGGKFFDQRKALEHARQMVEDGADIIDVGAESTRPGSQPVSGEEEQERLLPILELLKKEIAVPVSVDTYRASTAKAALDLGAEIINDVGGGKFDQEIARVAAEYQVPAILMHHEKVDALDTFGMIGAVVDGLRESMQIYAEAGLSPEKMMIDPGIGFGKGTQGNLILLNNLAALKTLPCPFLLGASRKSFIGETLDLPVTERKEGSLAAAAWGVFQDAAVVRVHDVKETARLVRLLEAIREAR
jgi:dihydropteroate synthase